MPTPPRPAAHTLLVALLTASALLAAACGSDERTDTTPATDDASTTTPDDADADGTATTTVEQVTATAACPTFPDLSGVEGAGDGYDLPEVSVACTEAELVVSSNGMPGYTYVPQTPNALETQDWSWHVPLRPEVASETTAISQWFGTVGFTVSGLPIYAAMEGPMPADEAFGDPIHNGIVDDCGGHTGPASEYHLHAIEETTACNLDDEVVGYAIDGIPIYGNSGTYSSGWVQTGDPTTDAWSAYTYEESSDPNVLDRCNGRVAEDGTYRYHRTDTFPYTIGCFAGTPTAQEGAAGGPMPAMG